jgi:hypothetical protein
MMTKLAEVADVEAAGVSRAIGADEAGAVEGEAHRQALDRHVVHHLVVAALQEGGIDRRERLHPVGGEAGGEGDRVLLGDADVEGAVREALAEHVDAGAGGHGGGDGDDLRVAFGVLDQLGREHLLVLRRVRLRLRLLSGDDVELLHAVQFVGRVLGELPAVSFFGDDVDQHRPVLDLLDVLQHADQVVHVVPVDRADVVEAELLEQGAAGGHAAGVFLGPLGHHLQRPRQVLGDVLAEPTGALVGPAGDQPGEIGAEAADRRGDRHVVVVEDDDQLARGVGGVVHRLVGHAGAHRAVADHRDHRVVVAALIAGHGEAERRRDRGGGVGGAERVVFALGPLGEAGEAAALAQGADAAAPSGEDLVRVDLVADVPDEHVARGFEHMVQGHRQLHHAQARAEVAAGDRDRGDGFGAKLVRELAQVGDGKPARIRGAFDGVQQRGRLRHQAA